MSRFLKKPSCCSAKLPPYFLSVLKLGIPTAGEAAEAFLSGLCHGCRNGQGIVLDLSGTQKADLPPRVFDSFAQRTGFQPQVIADRWALQRWQDEYWPDPSRPKVPEVKVPELKAA